LPRLRCAYKEWGYNGSVEDGDLVYVAAANGAMVGLVRRTHEHGVTLLRGMRVAPTYQRRGIGSKLLSVFAHDLANERCFCVPFSHLVGFYAAAGFLPMRDQSTPAFLPDRLRQYRSDGLDVLVMQRPAGN
jgi:GNAT superfamily N-acetyltransferase